MVKQNIEIEGARLIFPNFSGRGDQYNREGDRNFGVVIPDTELALTLQEDGWNIHALRPRNEGDDPTYWLPVAVKYGDYPPHIYMISGRKKVLMDEKTIGLLDDVEIECVDAIIRPYNWSTAQGSGVKAYIKTMYVVCRRDRFAAKYDFDEITNDEEEPFE